MLTIGSLFSGIGGLELGLERAGLGPVLWQCEINPFARRVLAKHWPDVTRFEDISKQREWPKVELICGGFPCQDISYAGKGAGLDGARSGLWAEYAKVIGKIGPRFVIVENVPALRSRGLGRVLGDISSLGYDAIWVSLSARDVGACHKRERIFIIANDRSERGTWELSEEIPKFSELSRRQDVRGASIFGDRPAVHTPELCRAGDGIPARLDRLRAIGNAVVPQCAQVIGQIIMRRLGANV
jgi:DNA (cytosine-5)-methyltransferase 1